MRTISAIALLSLAPIVGAQALNGVWAGTVTVNKQEIPFKFELSNDDSGVKGTFFNGQERYVSTAGELANGALTLKWDYFAATLEAKVANGSLDGIYSRRRSAPVAFHAVPAPKVSASAASAPNIDGLWELEDIKSSKGEHAWNFIVKQSGGQASAAILRVDGDTGTLSGSYKDGKFVLSHFSGLRPALLEVTPQRDGTLKVVLDGNEVMTAIRPAEARAKNLPLPTDPSRHTGVKDSAEPLHFNFPDLNGKLVAETDARFRGKVVLVNIFGSWCPNCHDEAPFLVEMYRKYRAEGLEIVALDFEEADQLKDPTRLRGFLARYGIDYTVLLGGTTDEAAAKLAQTENWDAWPTTFFVGRDGRVHGAHAGFPSKASGELYTNAKAEFEEKVQQLLAESALTAQN
jgi:thiol-disulfide isomerase/thioredoxin